MPKNSNTFEYILKIVWGAGRGRMFRRRCRMRCRRGRGWGWRFTGFQIRLPSLPKIRIPFGRDEKAEKIYELLPKRDCGACGYDSCYECALAIARGEAPPDACKIVGKKVAPQIERILRGG